MEKVTLSAKTVESINYLYKHLFDQPKPTSVPKFSPMGEQVTQVKDISAMMGIDKKVAAVYVLQDPAASSELKEDAREVLNPGIFVASDDVYLPVVHKAYDIISNPFTVEEKRIRMVRSVAGVRRFQQDRGSIIVDDGEPPLDALIALDNDIPGYEKIGDKSGHVYYIGREEGGWVVRDPSSGQVIHRGGTEQDSFRWLNQKAGGTVSGNVDRTKPQKLAREAEPEQLSPKRRTEDAAVPTVTLTRDQKRDVTDMTPEQLELYKILRERKLDHSSAMLLIRRLKARKGQK